ncbi:hypothetical protein DFH09DRAFT_1373442 [Mycena vulgaris]|nr:hypothetical protein DFH09DRAFT_1373442 [Mycena vulgaris]
MLSDTSSIPPGYLFLCPLRDLPSEIPSHFRLPSCPAYWSLDPSGAERLSTQGVEELGFPGLEFKMEVLASSWDESVYTGIRKFHEAKGYDRYSQDVAQELGCPLYQVLSELDDSVAHIQDLSEDELSDALKDDHFSSKECPREVVPEGSNLDPSLTRGAFHSLDTGELDPSTIWKIIVGVQFTLILALILLYLYDSMHSHISIS